NARSSTLYFSLSFASIQAQAPGFSGADRCDPAPVAGWFAILSQYYQTSFLKPESQRSSQSDADRVSGGYTSRAGRHPAYQQFLTVGAGVIDTRYAATGTHGQWRFAHQSGARWSCRCADTG